VHGSLESHRHCEKEKDKPFQVGGDFNARRFLVFALIFPFTMAVPRKVIEIDKFLPENPSSLTDKDMEKVETFRFRVAILLCSLVGKQTCPMGAISHCHFCRMTAFPYDPDGYKEISPKRWGARGYIDVIRYNTHLSRRGVSTRLYSSSLMVISLFLVTT
jgi:hypothetical protein